MRKICWKRKERRRRWWNNNSSIIIIAMKYNQFFFSLSLSFVFLTLLLSHFECCFCQLCSCWCCALVLEGVHFFSYLKARAKKISKNKIFMVMTGCIHELKAKKKWRQPNKRMKKKPHTRTDPRHWICSANHMTWHILTFQLVKIFMCV